LSFCGITVLAVTMSGNPDGYYQINEIFIIYLHNRYLPGSITKVHCLFPIADLVCVLFFFRSLFRFSSKTYLDHSINCASRSSNFSGSLGMDVMQEKPEAVFHQPITQAGFCQSHLSAEDFLHGSSQKAGSVSHR
jgi:hypothetical protein